MDLFNLALDYDNIPNYTDWRLPENRIEAFTRVTHQRFVEGDLDHHHVGKVIADYHNWDNDQKALYCMYFGQSYRNHWAMIAMQLDLYNMSDEQLTEWHDKNWHRMKFGNDTKWNVRKFPQFVMDIKKKIGNGSLYEYLGNAASIGSTESNYFSLNKTLQEFYSIGRMTAWLAQQTLYEFFDWDVDHWDQQLYDHGTWSQYDSICYLFNRIDIARRQKCYDRHGQLIEIKKYNPTKSDISLMEKYTVELMEGLNKRIPFHVDIYNVESVECEYRKTAYGPKIKEFTFWTTNELVEQYEKLRTIWDGYEGPGKVDWKPYVMGFMTKGRNVVDYGYHPDYFKVVSDYGMQLNTHHIYKDEPNAHETLSLQKNRSSSIRLMKENWKDWFTPEERTAFVKNYNPVKYLKFKDREHPAWSNPAIDYSYATGFTTHLNSL